MSSLLSAPSAWTHRISRPTSNLSLRHFLSVSISWKDLSKDDTSTFPRLPTEIWIKIVKYLIDDNDLDARSAIYELCLVSRFFRSFAQPALFHRLRIVDRNLSQQTYHALCRCGQAKYRHVLTHVHEFKIKISIPVPPTKTFTLSSSPPLHPISLLPFMTQLTTLSISVWINKDHLLPYILRRSTNKLTRLFFEFAETSPTTQEISEITAFISKQKHLKHLTLTFPRPILVPRDSLPQLESIEGDWKQILNFLPGKSGVKNIYIRTSGFSDIVQLGSEKDMEGIKKALTYIRYIRLDITELATLKLWEYAEDLQFLRISIRGLPPVSPFPNEENPQKNETAILIVLKFDFLNILSRFPKLKLVVLETPWPGERHENYRELFVYHLLMEIYSLECVIFNDLDTDVWVRKGFVDDGTFCEGVPEIYDLWDKSRRSGHVYYI